MIKIKILDLSIPDEVSSTDCGVLFLQAVRSMLNYSSADTNMTGIFESSRCESYDFGS